MTIDMSYKKSNNIYLGAINYGKITIRYFGLFSERKSFKKFQNIMLKALVGKPINSTFSIKTKTMVDNRAVWH